MGLYSKGFLVKLYAEMVKIRLCEESLVEPILRGEIKCPVHLYTGQEAVAVGFCAALRKKDQIFGAHRSHGHYLAKGGRLPELIAEIYCKQTGCSRGRGGSMHVIAPEVGVLGTVPIVAGTISLAVGAALASSIKKERTVTAVFFGDGATGEGVLYESLNFAALKRLPAIFVCENNLYSTHMPLRECRLKNNIFRTASPFGVKSLRVDGNDVLEVYEAANKAVRLCRAGKGPVFLECLTYRLHGHVGPDDNIQGVHTDIRSTKEIKKWKKRDPLLCFERFLLKRKILSSVGAQLIRRRIKDEVNDAHAFARQSPNPHYKEIIKDVFR